MDVAKAQALKSILAISNEITGAMQSLGFVSKPQPPPSAAPPTLKFPVAKDPTSLLVDMMVPVSVVDAVSNSYWDQVQRFREAIIAEHRTLFSELSPQSFVQVSATLVNQFRRTTDELFDVAVEAAKEALEITKMVGWSYV